MTYVVAGKKFKEDVKEPDIDGDGIAKYLRRHRETNISITMPRNVEKGRKGKP